MSPIFILLLMAGFVTSDPNPKLTFNYETISDDVYEQPINLMNPKTTLDNVRNTRDRLDLHKNMEEPWPFDFSQFDKYLSFDTEEDGHSYRVKRSPRKHGRHHRKSNSEPSDGGDGATRKKMTRSQKPTGTNKNFIPPPFFFKKEKKIKDGEEGGGVGDDAGKTDKNTTSSEEDVLDGTVMIDVPKDLYQAHLRPGVVFRVHMAEAILKMQYRNYEDDKDESVVEADVEYLRLTRKVISDEINKFEDLKWLVTWFANKTALIKEHSCYKKYLVVGIPPTLFTHQEEYMQRMCLFDNVYLDHIPYLIGDDSSLIAAVAPPVIFCDAATCTSVPFLDSAMFDAHLPMSEVRKVGRCEASCRDHCKNDVDCLKKCVDKCRRIPVYP